MVLRLALSQVEGNMVRRTGSSLYSLEIIIHMSMLSSSIRTGSSVWNLSSIIWSWTVALSFSESICCAMVGPTTSIEINKSIILILYILFDMKIPLFKQLQLQHIIVWGSGSSGVDQASNFHSFYFSIFRFRKSIHKENLFRDLIIIEIST